MRSWVEVSLGTIRANYQRRARESVKDAAEIMPVVKADAYRHGAVEVSHALESEGAPWLAVSNVEEGDRVCGKPASGTRILVMADFLPTASRRSAGVRPHPGAPFAQRHSAGGGAVSFEDR